MKSVTVRFKLPEGDLELVTQLVGAICNVSVNGVKPELILRVDNEVEVDLQVDNPKLVYDYVRKLIIAGLRLSDVKIEELPNKIRATGTRGKKTVEIEVDIKKI